MAAEHTQGLARANAPWSAFCYTAPMARSAPLERALQLLDHGHAEDAVAVLQQALESARQNHGEEHPSVARAFNDLGSLLGFLGDDEGAVQVLMLAAEIPGLDEESEKARLTYLLNLAEVTERAGSLTDAEDAIRRSLQGRREVYGAEHAGYAFGLEPLAHVLLRQGKLDDAREAIEEAVANFRHHKHPRIATALALRAEIVAASDSDDDLFGDLSDIPDELVAGLSDAVAQRCPTAAPLDARFMLSELIPAVGARLGEDHEAVLAAWAALANAEADGGDPMLRVTAIQRVLAARKAGGDEPAQLEALLGLALAQRDAGELNAADGSYLEALEIAERMGDAAAAAQVLRNYGLLLVEWERPEQAEARLNEAVHAAGRAGFADLVARCRLTLALHLFHAGREDEALPMLQAVVAAVGGDHPDGRSARAHLEAHQAGAPCGCGQIDPGFGQALKDALMRRLPPGLVDDVKLVVAEDGEPDIEVDLGREPSVREKEQLESVVRQAHAQLLSQLRRG
jgi:tetratricopeptide (TPR) repeat protein